MAQYINFDPYTIHTLNQNLQIIARPNIDKTKIGGGWCTVISAELFRDYLDIPEEFGPYGVDDTYIADACDILKSIGGVNYYQFIMENLVVTENRKYKNNVSYKSLIGLVDEDFASKYRKAASLKYLQMINKFSSEVSNGKVRKAKK